MKRGLVIGKFMPLHNGHIALIRFAADQCDELIVSLSFTPHDPIDGRLRFQWLHDFFLNDPKIKTEISVDDFDNDTLPLNERTQIWAAFIKRRFPPIDVIFSSEEYGEPFASNLGVEHIIFDLPRTSLPVSGTMIRNNPFRYWDFIPSVVRPYFVKKICFYGPESTGKSTLAEFFAREYETEFVPEVARELLTSNEFSVDDIVNIGAQQTQRVFEKAKTANKLLFCDTDLITTAIYSQYYLNTVPEIIYQLERDVVYDKYFLLDIDTTWVADGLRDLGEKRSEMYQIFRQQLEVRNIRFISVSGSWDQRVEIIRAEINRSYFPVA